MSHMVVGLFNDSKLAGEAIAFLKDKGYAKDISVITKKGADKADSKDVKKDISDGTKGGAVAGAAMVGLVAGLTVLLAGAVNVVLPGLGLIVLGPLAAGLTGAAGGAVAGGLVGMLVDAGFPEEQAKMYEHQIGQGQTLVSVTVTEEKADWVRKTYEKYQAQQINLLNKKS